MLVQADLSSVHKSAPHGSFSPAACWVLASPTSSHRILAAVPSRHVLLQFPFSGGQKLNSAMLCNLHSVDKHVWGTSHVRCCPGHAGHRGDETDPGNLSRDRGAGSGGRHRMESLWGSRAQAALAVLNP